MIKLKTLLSEVIITTREFDSVADQAKKKLVKIIKYLPRQNKCVKKLVSIKLMYMIIGVIKVKERC